MLFVQWRSKNGDRSVSDIAAAVLPIWQATYRMEEIVNEIQTMIDAGSRYRNIEKQIGTAATFVMGTALSESLYVLSHPLLASGLTAQMDKNPAENRSRVYSSHAASP